MTLNVRVYIDPGKTSRNTSGSVFYQGGGVPSDGVRRPYVCSNGQDLVLSGVPFRCAIPDEDVALVSARTQFYGSTALAAPAYVPLSGVGTFYHGKSVVIITTNDSPNGWNLSMESPSVTEFNATLDALRNGEITPDGKEQTVLQLLTAELASVKQKLEDYKEGVEAGLVKIEGMWWYKVIKFCLNAKSFPYPGR